MAYRYKRKNKKFPDTWYVSWREHGKKKYKRIGSWEPAASAFQREVEERLSYQSAGIERPAKDAPLKDAIDKYLKYSKTNKAARTVVVDEYVLRKLLLSFFDSKNITDLKEVYLELLEDFKIERLAAVEKITHNREITSIKAFFNMMVQWGYLRDSPAKYLKKLRLPVNVPRFLTKAELKNLLKAARGDVKSIIQILLYTGLRRNELLYLRWQDIDMENKRVLVQNKEGFHTKNYQPRVIPMHGKLFPVFKRLAKEKGQYVIPGLRSDIRIRVNYHIRDVAKKAKLEGVTPHTLRHTFASQLAMAGVPIRTIQILMGHANITTTMIYAHLSPEHLQGAVEKLGF